MEPIMNKSKNFAAAEQWDIEQHNRLTPTERREMAFLLKKKVYGDDFSPLRKNRVVNVLKGFLNQISNQDSKSV
jgi:hypothetical protein